MPASTPLRLHIPMEWTNVPEDIDQTWMPSAFDVNITLEHSWNVVREALWRSSESYFLKPMFVKLYFNGTQVPDLTPFSQLWADIVDSSDIQGWADRIDSLKAVVDLTLINNPAIPRRDPVEEWFDVCIRWMGRDINLRQTLNSTVGSLKEHIDADPHNIVIFNPQFRQQTDDTQPLSELLYLDVIPLDKVNILAAPTYPLAVETVVIKVGTIHLKGLPNNFEFPRFTTCKQVDSMIRERANLDRNARAEFSFNSSPFEADSEAPFLDMLKKATYTGGHYIIQYAIDVDQPQSRPEPTPTQPREPKLMAPIEPLRILVGPDLEWRLTGETYEYIEANRPNSSGQLVLVKQTELNPVKHRFRYQDLEETLGHNQCLIVDNGMHQPYALINQSGTSKLHRKFKDASGDSILQQVVVETHDHRLGTREPMWDAEVRANNPQAYPDDIPAPPAAVPAAAAAAQPARDNRARPLVLLLQMLRANLQQVGARFFQVALVMYLTGLYGPILRYPTFSIFFSSFSISLYVFFASGDKISGWIEENLLVGGDEARLDYRFLRLIVSTLRYTNNFGVAIGMVFEELVTIATQRKYDFEYITDEDLNRTGLWYWITDWFTNLWKDILIYFLALIPSLFVHIETEKYRMFNGELAKLEAVEAELESHVLASIELYKAHRERAGNAIERTPEEILKQLMELNPSEGGNIDSKLEQDLVSGVTSEADEDALVENDEIDDSNRTAADYDEETYQKTLTRYRQLHFAKRIILEKLVSQV